MWLSTMNSEPETVPATDQSAVRADRERPGLATHYLRYSISNALVMCVGFISFPILTRLLDNAQYGIFRYYEALMLLGVALMKLGGPHAIVRFYPYDGDAHSVRTFGTNLVVLPVVLSTVLCGFVAVGLLVWHERTGRSLHPVALCAVLMVPMLAASALMQMVARASERSDIVIATRIIGRLLELVLVLGAVILVQQSALAVFGGKFLATILLLAWLVRWTHGNVHIAWDAIDLRVFRRGLIYGLPLMANELSHHIMGSLDRVLLKEITGDFAAVGIYAIGYALAMHVNVFITATLWEAFTPVVTRVYEADGASAVRALKDRVLLPMTYAVVAIAAMLVVSGNDLLVVLSGPDKGASGEVFVIVGVSISLFALFDVATYGLLLKKRSLTLFLVTFAVALLNVALNFLLIPRMGYMGAAWATAITYTVLSVVWCVACPKGLLRFPDARTVIVSLSCATLLIALARGSDLFGVDGPWLRLLVAAGLFGSLYALPVWFLDARLRSRLLALRPLRR